MHFFYSDLLDFAHLVFRKIGCKENEAKLASKVLLSADLRGIDSHGVARLSGYIRLWEAGRINSQPKITTIHETPSTATVDGDAGLGLVVAPKAMQLAITKAREVGTGWVAVKNSNHFGIAGYHSMLALAEDMIGISMTNASPLVAPTYSNERLLGTNPISIAIPAKSETPFVGDFATTTAANGKLEILQRQNKAVPFGWVQDKKGSISENPFAVQEGGALLPLGGDKQHGSHKGYILGAMVDILSAVLSGAGYGPWAPPFVSFLQPPKDPVGDGLGHFFGAMRVDAFRPKEDFLEHMDNWIRRFRNSSTTDGHKNVLIPGDPERQVQEKRVQDGFELNAKVHQDLLELSKKFEIPLKTS
jgi:LDH2 family malate/lactate/ureidoglycolate dehydrogenase